MTVQELCDKAGEVLLKGGLSVMGVSCPTQPVEVAKTEDNPKGVANSARQLYNKSIPSTHERLSQPLAALVKELTTRSDGHLTLDDPIDITNKKLYTGVAPFQRWIHAILTLIHAI